MATKQAFFPTVRTDPKLKQEVDKVLSDLGLPWSTFAIYTARKLVAEKRVVFEIRDEAGFTPTKSEELKKALADVRKGKHVTKSLTLKQSQRYLAKL